jgi:hypothetical protein
VHSFYGLHPFNYLLNASIPWVDLIENTSRGSALCNCWSIRALLLRDFQASNGKKHTFQKKSLRCNKIELCAPLPRGRAVRPGLFNYLK